VPLDRLREDWRARSAEQGLSHFRLRAILGRAWPRTHDAHARARVAIELASADGLTRESSTITRRDVLQALADAAGSGAHVRELEAQADAFLDGEEIVALDAVAGEGRYTTRELLRIERELLDGSIRRRGDSVGLADEAEAAAALDARATLSGEQRRLVSALTRSGDGVQVVRAAAGTDKTFGLDAARQAWQNSGVPVLGCALSARAACELRDQAGVDATTIARLRHALARGIELAPGSVLIVDEAGMVGTRDLATLADAAGRARAKLVLVGDDRQLPEIDAGGTFRALAQRLGAVELREVHRQRESWDRDALTALRGGDPEDFARAYHAHGCLIAAPTADAARDTLAADWWRAHKAGERTLMIAHRRSDVADLNQRARALLRDAGRLGPDALRTDNRAFAVGDRVITTRNDRGLAVVNGQAGTLTSLHNGQVLLKLDNGRDHRAPRAGRHRRPRLRPRLRRALSRVGLHRPLPPPRRSAFLRQRRPNLPQPGPRAAARWRHPAARRADARRQPSRAPRLGQGQGPRHRHRTGPVTTQLSFEEGRHAPRGLTRAELMTAREVAELISVPISTVREWGRNGTLPRVKLGRHVRYIRRHVEAAILDAEEGPQHRSAMR